MIFQSNMFYMKEKQRLIHSSHYIIYSLSSQASPQDVLIKFFFLRIATGTGSLIFPFITRIGGLGAGREPKDDRLRTEVAKQRERERERENERRTKEEKE